MAMVIVSVSNQASALSPAKEAASYFEQGTKAFKAQRYLKAAEKFMRAYEIAPHGAALYNAALAWEKAGDVERSADAFEQAIDTGQLTGKQQTDAEKRLDKWKTRLGKLVFAEQDGVTVTVGRFHDKEPPFHGYFKPGSYEVAFSSVDDRTRVEQVEVAAGVIMHVDAPEDSPGDVTRDRSKDEEQKGGSHTLAWVSLGVAGAATGGAILLGLRALDAKSEFERSEYTSQDAHDRADSYRTWTNVSWAAAGLFAVSGGALLLWGGKEEGARHSDEQRADDAATTVVLTPTIGGAAIWGNF